VLKNKNHAMRDFILVQKKNLGTAINGGRGKTRLVRAMSLIPVDSTKQEFDYMQAARDAGFRFEEDSEPIQFMTAGGIVVPREYAVPDRIPLRQVTLFAGPGGIGKSLVTLQLLCSTVLARGWIGSQPQAGPVIYLGAEDEQDEIQHRLGAIAAQYDEPVSVSELIGGGLYASSYAGQDMTLARFNRKTGVIEPTPLYNGLLQQSCDIRPVIVALDTLSDIFGGDENNRVQVSAFVGLLRNLAMTANCAVIVTQHPSQAGTKSGDGTSGSTAWHGKVRGRMYMRAATKEEGDPDLRVLEFVKNQYGALAPKVMLRFENGIFIPEMRGGSIDPEAEQSAAEAVFLNLLDRFAREGRNVCDKKGTTFAPALFAKEKEATSQKLNKGVLADAMIRLFASGKIRVVTDGPTSRLRSRIVTV
jgi:RecA-family ATPase